MYPSACSIALMEPLRVTGKPSGLRVVHSRRADHIVSNIAVSGSTWSAVFGLSRDAPIHQILLPPSRNHQRLRHHLLAPKQRFRDPHRTTSTTPERGSYARVHRSRLGASSKTRRTTGRMCTWLLGSALSMAGAW